MVTKYIKIPIYTGTIVLKVFETIEDLNEKFGDPKSPCDSTCFKEGFFKYIIAFHKNTRLSTFVHECVHLSNMIFEYHGVKLDVKNDEHQAYFITWIFEQLQSKINENGKIKIL
jgi:hypothetical protein